MKDRDRLIGLVDKAKEEYANDITDHTETDYIVECLFNNGIIVPPCKVGQTVYYVSFGRIYKGKCHAITLKPTMQIHLYDYDGDNASISADRVFLTKEEAEAELQKRSDNNA